MRNHDVLIIAEVGQAHDGSLGILHSYIDAVAKTGVNAIKFQTHIAEAESSALEPFRINFSYEDKTRYDYWKRMSFSLSQWEEIKAHCDEVGLEFVSSPFSIAAVDLLEKIGVSQYKIGSGEVTNQLMLDVIKQTGKPIILSSGMSGYEELDQAVGHIKTGSSPLSILQCTSKYPSQSSEIGLNVVAELKKRYELPVGLSDHSGTPYPSLAAVALGAEVIEAHVIFDRRMFGPDATSSLLVDEFLDMVTGIRAIETMLRNPIDKNNTEDFVQMKSIFEKSLAVNKDLPAGHIIKMSDLESKKPSGCGVLASDYKNILGKTLVNPIKKWEFLTEENFNEKN